eukprot:CAMPEP_0115285790 /NCGR_PEP_ID=MMETSP0270-20121206/61612_1 /TAXON_ID=71861 /ORGANISM="Scrippsiella trochoidea, Strain CCMP3099" /LENGTH=65 /DNA_ID=CAMNT_0002702823 /DNA_START=163 /DNA_END=360 /DNA_ORIENTATION=+
MTSAPDKTPPNHVKDGARDATRGDEITGRAFASLSVPCQPADRSADTTHKAKISTFASSCAWYPE